MQNNVKKLSRSVMSIFYRENIFFFSFKKFQKFLEISGNNEKCYLIDTPFKYRVCTKREMTTPLYFWVWLRFFRSWPSMFIKNSLDLVNSSSELHKQFSRSKKKTNKISYCRSTEFFFFKYISTIFCPIFFQKFFRNFWPKK
jgi:hypothetical protein